jgi:F-type H+-transporting ATPase subunit delta
MSELRVAVRYARSLFDIAIEKNMLDKIEQDAQAFLSICKSNRDYENMLRSPIVHGDKKLSIIKAIFGSSLSDITYSFINIVIRKKREIVLKEIFEQFMEMYNERKGVINATVYTAVTVTDKIKEDIVRFLEKETNKKVELKSAVNQDILGGFVLQYEDKLIDASVASKLRLLRNHLINNN